MVNYDLILEEFNQYVDTLCTNVEQMAANEDLGNILPLGTATWGLIKVICGHVDDATAVMGTARATRMVAATATCEARD